MFTSTNCKGGEEEEEEKIYPSQFRPEDKEKIEDLTCAICMGTTEGTDATRTYDPVTACQHYFCRRCILASLQEKKECPTCRRPTTTDQLIPARMLERKLASLQVACVFRKQGCSWKGAMGPSAKDYFAHLGVCDEAPIDCEFKHFELKECQEKITRKHYPAHLEKYSAQHFPLLYKERKVTKRKLEEKEEEISKLKKIIRGDGFYEKKQLTMSTTLLKLDETTVACQAIWPGHMGYKAFIKCNDDNPDGVIFLEEKHRTTASCPTSEWDRSTKPVERISFYGEIPEHEVLVNKLTKEICKFLFKSRNYGCANNSKGLINFLCPFAENN